MIEFLLGLGRSAAIIGGGIGAFVALVRGVIIPLYDRPWRKLGGRWA